VIAEGFGTGVAELVDEVTDDKKLDKQERKRLQVVHAHKKSERVAMPPPTKVPGSCRTSVSVRLRHTAAPDGAAPFLPPNWIK
jgi:hypothetical protein